MGPDRATPTGLSYEKAAQTAYFDIRVGGRTGLKGRFTLRDISYRNALKEGARARREAEVALEERDRSTPMTLAEYLARYPERLEHHEPGP